MLYFILAKTYDHGMWEDMHHELPSRVNRARCWFLGVPVDRSLRLVRKWDGMIYNLPAGAPFDPFKGDVRQQLIFMERGQRLPMLFFIVTVTFRLSVAIISTSFLAQDADLDCFSCTQRESWYSNAHIIAVLPLVFFNMVPKKSRFEKCFSPITVGAMRFSNPDLEMVNPISFMIGVSGTRFEMPALGRRRRWRAS